MRITTQGEYGLRCVLDIARKKGGITSIGDISISENLPRDYVEQILLKLRRKRIIKSVRGVKGGYLLARSPKSITVYDIIAALEREIFNIFCDKPKARISRCIHKSDCRLKGLWLQLKRDIEATLKSKTVAALL